MALNEKSSGVALIKNQFLLHDKNNDSEKKSQDFNDGPRNKKTKLEKRRGQNKNRYFANQFWVDKSQNLCNVLIDVLEGTQAAKCEYPNCKNIHSVSEYLKLKSQNLEGDCYVFNTKGHCPRGVTCCFASEHITEDGKNRVKYDLADKFKNEAHIKLLTKDLQVKLRKRLYDFSKADTVVKSVIAHQETTCNATLNDQNVKIDPAIETKISEDKLASSPNNDLSQGSCDSLGKEQSISGKKKIDWKGKLYLSPLTTVGNLPFRRICKEWGADITCGEMAMAQSLLKGEANEWALLKRHSSENLFGVQVCGNNPGLLARCVQLIEESVEVDFIDLNLGCPIDLVYRNGGGSALLTRRKQLDAIIRSMNQTSLTIPITIKTRTGVYDGKNVALNYMPLFTNSGASLITVHGRSREQRYTRLADWEYVRECASAATPTPVFGNGDILSFQDYNSIISKYPEISGVMIGRGALYKPWIFTEIKEQRDWDISSSERLDILRKYVNYGYEHWGSDKIGVEKTRRFLLEWLSFLHRYIPVGLLERPPQKINERPPRYIGRNDLETLMASSNSVDWVKISEMLCGPVPDNFQFLPKHRANAW